MPPPLNPKRTPGGQDVHHVNLQRDQHRSSAPAAEDGSEDHTPTMPLADESIHGTAPPAPATTPPVSATRAMRRAPDATQQMDANDYDHQHHPRPHQYPQHDGNQFVAAVSKDQPPASDVAGTWHRTPPQTPKAAHHHHRHRGFQRRNFRSQRNRAAPAPEQQPPSVGSLPPAAVTPPIAPRATSARFSNSLKPIRGGGGPWGQTQHHHDGSGDNPLRMNRWPAANTQHPLPSEPPPPQRNGLQLSRHPTSSHDHLSAVGAASAASSRTSTPAAKQNKNSYYELLPPSVPHTTDMHLLPWGGVAGQQRPSAENLTYPAFDSRSRPAAKAKGAARPTGEPKRMQQRGGRRQQNSRPPPRPRATETGCEAADWRRPPPAVNQQQQRREARAATGWPRKFQDAQAVAAARGDDFNQLTMIDVHEDVQQQVTRDDGGGGEKMQSSGRAARQRSVELQQRLSQQEFLRSTAASGRRQPTTAQRFATSHAGASYHGASTILSSPASPSQQRQAQRPLSDDCPKGDRGASKLSVPPPPPPATADYLFHQFLRHQGESPLPSPPPPAQSNSLPLGSSALLAPQGGRGRNQKYYDHPRHEEGDPDCSVDLPRAGCQWYTLLDKLHSHQRPAEAIPVAARNHRQQVGGFKPVDSTGGHQYHQPRLQIQRLAQSGTTTPWLLPEGDASSPGLVAGPWTPHMRQSGSLFGSSSSSSSSADVGLSAQSRHQHSSNHHQVSAACPALMPLSSFDRAGVPHRTASEASSATASPGRPLTDDANFSRQVVAADSENHETEVPPFVTARQSVDDSTISSSFASGGRPCHPSHSGGGGGGASSIGTVGSLAHDFSLCSGGSNWQSCAAGRGSFPPWARNVGSGLSTAASMHSTAMTPNTLGGANNPTMLMRAVVADSSSDDAASADLLESFALPSRQDSPGVVSIGRQTRAATDWSTEAPATYYEEPHQSRAPKLACWQGPAWTEAAPEFVEATDRHQGHDHLNEDIGGGRLLNTVDVDVSAKADVRASGVVSADTQATAAAGSAPGGAKVSRQRLTEDDAVAAAAVELAADASASTVLACTSTADDDGGGADNASPDNDGHLSAPLPQSHSVNHFSRTAARQWEGEETYGRAFEGLLPPAVSKGLQQQLLAIQPARDEQQMNLWRPHHLRDDEGRRDAPTTPATGESNQRVFTPGFAPQLIATDAPAAANPLLSQQQQLFADKLHPPQNAGVKGLQQTSGSTLQQPAPSARRLSSMPPAVLGPLGITGGGDHHQGNAAGIAAMMSTSGSLLLPPPQLPSVAHGGEGDSGRFLVEALRMHVQQTAGRHPRRHESAPRFDDTTVSATPPYVCEAVDGGSLAHQYYQQKVPRGQPYWQLSNKALVPWPPQQQQQQIASAGAAHTPHVVRNPFRAAAPQGSRAGTAAAAMLATQQQLAPPSAAFTAAAASGELPHDNLWFMPAPPFGPSSSSSSSLKMMADGSGGQRDFWTYHPAAENGTNGGPHVSQNELLSAAYGGGGSAAFIPSIAAAQQSSANTSATVQGTGDLRATASSIPLAAATAMITPEMGGGGGGYVGGAASRMVAAALSTGVPHLHCNSHQAALARQQQRQYNELVAFHHLQQQQRLSGGSNFHAAHQLFGTQTLPVRTQQVPAALAQQQRQPLHYQNSGPPTDGGGAHYRAAANTHRTAGAALSQPLQPSRKNFPLDEDADEYQLPFVGVLGSFKLPTLLIPLPKTPSFHLTVVPYSKRPYMPSELRHRQEKPVLTNMVPLHTVPGNCNLPLLPKSVMTTPAASEEGGLASPQRGEEGESINRIPQYKDDASAAPVEGASALPGTQHGRSGGENTTTATFCDCDPDYRDRNGDNPGSINHVPTPVAPPRGDFLSLASNAAKAAEQEQEIHQENKMPCSGGGWLDGHHDTDDQRNDNDESVGEPGGGILWSRPGNRGSEETATAAVGNYSHFSQRKLLSENDTIPLRGLSRGLGLAETSLVSKIEDSISRSKSAWRKSRETNYSIETRDNVGNHRNGSRPEEAFSLQAPRSTVNSADPIDKEEFGNLFVPPERRERAPAAETVQADDHNGGERLHGNSFSSATHQRPRPAFEKRLDEELRRRPREQCAADHDPERFKKIGREQHPVESQKRQTSNAVIKDSHTMTYRKNRWRNNAQQKQLRDVFSAKMARLPQVDAKKTRESPVAPRISRARRISKKCPDGSTGGSKDVTVEMDSDSSRETSCNESSGFEENLKPEEEKFEDFELFSGRQGHFEQKNRATFATAERPKSAKRIQIEAVVDQQSAWGSREISGRMLDQSTSRIHTPPPASHECANIYADHLPRNSATIATGYPAFVPIGAASAGSLLNHPNMPHYAFPAPHAAGLHLAFLCCMTPPLAYAPPNEVSNWASFRPPSAPPRVATGHDYDYSFDGHLPTSRVPPHPSAPRFIPPAEAARFAVAAQLPHATVGASSLHHPMATFDYGGAHPQPHPAACFHMLQHYHHQKQELLLAAAANRRSAAQPQAKTGASSHPKFAQPCLVSV